MCSKQCIYRFAFKRWFSARRQRAFWCIQLNFDWFSIVLLLRECHAIFISFVYIVVSLILIFSIIRTLDYPDFLLRSRRVRIIEVRLYFYLFAALCYVMLAGHTKRLVLGIFTLLYLTSKNPRSSSFNSTSLFHDPLIFGGEAGYLCIPSSVKAFKVFLASSFRLPPRTVLSTKKWVQFTYHYINT